MLPYRLRTPTFGSVSENRKRRLDGSQQEASTGGGPVQRAISLDLKAFQQSFLDLLEQEMTMQKKIVEEEKNNSGLGRQRDHWTSGKAFGIFKKLFGSNKIALLHLLVPHPRCDREAYAQILYSVCLEHFRCAMIMVTPTTTQEVPTTPSLSSLLLPACAAVWTLYTFYETNPLLRTDQMTPMDYLPMGLQSRGENPRALYRRAFRQRIRIDRQHFYLLLRLQEHCRLCMDHCGQELFCAGTFDNSTHCVCGFARDTLIILERLSSCLDFCEYTGPVGLEAMAGHPDYPYSEAALRHNQSKKGISSSTAQLDEPATVEQLPIRLEEQVSMSSTILETMMKDYQTKIQSIHLGSTKNKLSSQLLETLQPVLPQEGKTCWSEMIQQLQNGVWGLAQQQQRQQVSTNPNNNINLLKVNHDPGTENAPAQACMAQEDSDPSVCQLQVPEDLSAALQSHIRNAFEQLLQREGPDFLRVPPQVEEDTDRGKETNESIASDVSTLGVGGISVATGQGHAALQNLLTKAANRQGSDRVPSRVAAMPPFSHPNQLGENRIQTARFLDLDQTVPCSDHEDDSDDDASNISNLSVELGDDDDEKDEASAATSAVGRRALDLLLAKVSKKPIKKGRSKPESKRKIPNKPTAALQTDQSLASSIGVGGVAIESLLNRAGVVAAGYGAPANSQSRKRRVGRVASATNKRTAIPGGENRKGSKRKRSKPSTRTALGDGRSEGIGSLDVDSESHVSSVGPGKGALGVLMKLAVPEGATRNTCIPTSPPQENKRYEEVDNVSEPCDEGVENATEDDDHKSLASSVGPGGAALGALLKRVGSLKSSGKGTG